MQLCAGSPTKSIFPGISSFERFFGYEICPWKDKLRKVPLLKCCKTFVKCFEKNNLDRVRLWQNEQALSQKLSLVEYWNNKIIKFPYPNKFQEMTECLLLISNIVMVSELIVVNYYPGKFNLRCFIGFWLHLWGSTAGADLWKFFGFTSRFHFRKSSLCNIQF